MSSKPPVTTFLWYRELDNSSRVKVVAMQEFAQTIAPSFESKARLVGILRARSKVTGLLPDEQTLRGQLPRSSQSPIPMSIDALRVDVVSPKIGFAIVASMTELSASPFYDEQSHIRRQLPVSRQLQIAEPMAELEIGRIPYLEQANVVVHDLSRVLPVQILLRHTIVSSEQ